MARTSKNQTTEEQTMSKNEAPSAKDTGFKKVLVWWNEANIITVGAFVQGESSSARILPGVNRIDQDVWFYLTRHPIMKMNIEDGSLKLLNPDGDSSWDDYAPEEGLKYIKGMSDILELEDISVSSKKPKLRAAAKERIEAIMKLIKPKE
jgi:hypothetical protein